MSREQVISSVDPRQRSEVASPNHLLFYGAILVIVVLDQLTKAWAVANLSLYQPTELFSWLTPLMSLTLTHNTGVAFGLFQGLGNLFAVVSVLVLVGIFAFRRTMSADDLWIHGSLGLVVGGAVGNNIIDRLFRGHVIDFFDVNLWPLHNWPVFNIADSAIVVGVTVLLLDSFFADVLEVPADGE